MYDETNPPERGNKGVANGNDVGPHAEKKKSGSPELDSRRRRHRHSEPGVEEKAKVGQSSADPEMGSAEGAQKETRTDAERARARARALGLTVQGPWARPRNQFRRRRNAPCRWLDAKSGRLQAVLASSPFPGLLFYCILIVSAAYYVRVGLASWTMRPASGTGRRRTMSARKTPLGDVEPYGLALEMTVRGVQADEMALSDRQRVDICHARFWKESPSVI